MNTSEKLAYAKPVVNHVGSFEEVTLAGACPGALDMTFPGGTPSEDITCLS